MRVNKLDYGRIEGMLGKPFDPVRLFLTQIPYLLEEARQTARNEAFSYRNFHVAGAMYAVNISEKVIWQDTAGNVKVRSDKDKVCAERKLLRRAAKAGMTSVIGMVVLGTTNRQLIKDVSGLATPTLHMCDVCRDEVRINPLISSQTLVVTAGIESDIHQTLTVGQILDGYDRPNSEARAALFDFQSDFTDWEQRVAHYERMTNGAGETELTVDMRQMLAQIALTQPSAA